MEVTSLENSEGEGETAVSPSPEGSSAGARRDLRKLQEPERSQSNTGASIMGQCVGQSWC